MKGRLFLVCALSLALGGCSDAKSSGGGGEVKSGVIVQSSIADGKPNVLIVKDGSGRKISTQKSHGKDSPNIYSNGNVTITIEGEKVNVDK